jgi:multidrug resistance efflux pump
MKTIRRFRYLLWLLGLAVLVVSLAAAGASFRSGSAATPPAESDRESAWLVSCSGHVDVKHGVVSLYPTQGGRVAEVLVEENEHVKKGAVLLRLEDRLIKIQIKEAQADLEAAKAQLVDIRNAPQRHDAQVNQMRAGIDALQERLAAARRVRDDKVDLRAIVVVRQSEVDVARNQVKELEALLAAEKAKLTELQLHNPAVAVRQAEEAVQARQARLEQAQEQLRECGLRAPADGKVLRIQVGAGDVLSAAARQPAVQYCPDTPRFVRAEVEQEVAFRVQVGQRVIIRDDSSDTTVWNGQVATISDWFTPRRSVLQEPMQVNDVRTVECLITLDPDQPPLRIGQRVRVLIGKTSN